MTKTPCQEMIDSMNLVTLKNWKICKDNDWFYLKSINKKRLNLKAINFQKRYAVTTEGLFKLDSRGTR